MSIRLSTLESAGRELRDCFRIYLPLLFLARLCSLNPRDWCFLWLGWRVLHAFHRGTIASNKEIITATNKNVASNGNSKSKLTRYSITRMDTQNNMQHFSSLPGEVRIHICSFLHPKDVTTLACVNTTTRLQANENDLWKFLWYRDYGNVLLQWDVGRQVLEESLSSSDIDEHDNTDRHSRTTLSLETRLSQRLQVLAVTNTETKSTFVLKEFYFVFGEIYINYLSANRNHEHNCLLGLHGHVFDFTKFAPHHPGLIDPILEQIGQDATKLFESLPHSKGAREIALHLCVLVNRSTMNGCNDYSSCGLYLPPPVENLEQLLQVSNTRPPRLVRNYRDHKSEWMSCILPNKPRSRTQKPPTLRYIRIKRDEEQKLTEKEVSKSSRAVFPLGRQHAAEKRIYYDPLLQGWKQWDPCKC